MKKIIAYIKPHKLSKVSLALHGIEELTGMTVMDVRGFGRGKAEDVHTSKTEDLLDFIPHVKIEIICRDTLVDELVTIIEKTAHTGLRGDGKIYISDVHDAVRIQTGERGELAV